MAEKFTLWCVSWISTVLIWEAYSQVFQPADSTGWQQLKPTWVRLAIGLIALILGVAITRTHAKYVIKGVNENESERVEEIITHLWDFPELRDPEKELWFGLYLRSFRTRQLFKYSRLKSVSDIFHRIQFGTDFETLITLALAEFQMYLVKLGLEPEDVIDTDDPFAVRGTAIPTNDNRWTDHLDNLLWQAPIVFLVPGSSDGIAAELWHILSHREYVEKTLIVFPPAHPTDRAVASLEIAAGLGLTVPENVNVHFCTDIPRLIHAYELQSFLQQMGFEYESMPEEMAKLQRPYRTLYEVHHSSESRTRNFGKAFATVAKNAGQTSLLWPWYEAFLENDFELTSEYDVEG